MNTIFQKLINDGITPDYLLESVTASQIIESPEADYNRQAAETKLKSYSKYDAKFYKLNDGDRTKFYVVYNVNGYRMFTKLDLFYSCMSDQGFRQAHLIEVDGSLFVKLDTGSRYANVPHNKRAFADRQMNVTDL